MLPINVGDYECDLEIPVSKEINPNEIHSSMFSLLCKTLQIIDDKETDNVNLIEKVAAMVSFVLFA